METNIYIILFSIIMFLIGIKLTLKILILFNKLFIKTKESKEQNINEKEKSKINDIQPDILLFSPLP